jgi:hypothetical protein
MKVYAVFEPRMRGDDLMRHAERFTFVRDGFSFPAFIFGPLWMLRHRLWLALVAYIVLIVLLGVAVYYRALPVGAEAAVAFILAVLIGLEAATLRRRKLLWWRWRDAGIVVADDVVAAEQRFFDRWVARAGVSKTADVVPTAIAPAASAPAEPVAEPPPPSPAAPKPAYDPDSYVIGMFPPPGGTR